MPNDTWREKPIGKWTSEDEYPARVICNNGCGYLGGRTIFIKRGVLRSSITDVTCNVCGCPAKVV